MTSDTTVLAAYELEMFEARNAAMREFLDADRELSEALAAFPPGAARDAVEAGLESWSVSFSVLTHVAGVGGSPREHPRYAACQEAGDAVDVALADLPYTDDRDRLIVAIRGWIEARRTMASYRHVPPRAWWKND